MKSRVWGFALGPDEWGWMWGDPAGRPRQRRGRRRRRQWFDSGDMKYVILKLLRDRPMHGYEVMKALEEETQGCYRPSPGTVYPTLQWLEDEGLVEAEDKDGKKVYHITDAGLDFLDENETTVEDIFDRVQETIETIFSDPMPEVTRLVGQLVGQTYKATWRFKEDPDQQQKIIELLERALKSLNELK